MKRIQNISIFTPFVLAIIGLLSNELRPFFAPISILCGADSVGNNTNNKLNNNNIVDTNNYWRNPYNNTHNSKAHNKWWSDNWEGESKDGIVLKDSIDTILAFTSTKKRDIVLKHIDELLSGRYNDLNPKRVLIRISNILKNGNVESLCNANKSFVVIGLPHVIFNCDIFYDIKLETINILIKNIINNLSECEYNVQGNNTSFITDGCVSQSDRDIIYGKIDKTGTTVRSGMEPSNFFYDAMMHCSVDNLGSGEKTMACVQKELATKDVQLSSTCAECFKDSVDCGKSNCWLKCLFGNPCSNKCYNCGVTYCNVDLIKCTGLDDLPPACI
ncbi:conserved Plasmodium protein, unknown function [Plasmodium vinckei brucechwatti]|uniref:Uncharacterized protein n=1 Tax=Plasmodium vinckei brucechwatti TaxID=119398 RepID=A0A6V7SPQ5_PLAVN|nr:conserved Plasmodium protein, unknown function [Plasmodium vinckei brucechwatti]